MDLIIGVIVSIAATIATVALAYFVLGTIFGITLSAVAWMAITVVVTGFMNVLAIVVADWLDW